MAVSWNSPTHLPKSNNRRIDGKISLKSRKKATKYTSLFTENTHQKNIYREQMKFITEYLTVNRNYLTK